MSDASSPASILKMWKKNQPLINLLHNFAEKKKITPAQLALAWMLHKNDFVVPIPGMRKDERLIENLGAAEIELTDSEFEYIQAALDKITIYGNRTDEDIHKLGTVHAIDMDNNP